MEIGLLVTLVGVCVAGFAAVLGIWMERDDRKPPRYAYALSALILLATVVSIAQSYMDSKTGEKLEGDMARLLQQMDKIASNSNDPELMNLISGELAAQSRANPNIVEKLAQRVADEGGDPTEMLGRHLDASELEGISRKGLVKVKKKSTKKVAAKKKKVEPKPEPVAAKVAAPAPLPITKENIEEIKKTGSVTAQKDYKQKGMSAEEANLRRAAAAAAAGGPGPGPGRGAKGKKAGRGGARAGRGRGGRAGAGRKKKGAAGDAAPAKKKKKKKAPKAKAKAK